MWTELKPQRGSLKKLQAHRKQRSTHCENILYQGPKGNKGRRMLEERWTVLAANEKMTQVDTISINTLWNIALVLLLCKTLVWETTQRAVLINKFQYFDFWSLPSIFDHAGRFEVQQFGDPATWSKNKAVNLRGRWGPIPGRNAFEFNTRYRIKKVSRNLLNPNSAIGHSKFMCWIWIVFCSI